MEKRLFSVLMVFLLVLSSITLADENTDNCAGFFGSIKCFLWGNLTGKGDV
ncbi:hypothetical protein HZC30_02910 [Candidatus Woesearchaeota archaeon]|nr:hypothetical protein [Candidatus Woesearchaeota archaeon]